MTCRSRTPEFCRKSRQPQAYCCVQPSRGGQQADLHSEGLRKRAKNILSRFASLFITQWVQSVTSHIYTPQQVAGYSFHKTLMQTFTLSTNKHPQWSSGDRFGPAHPAGLTGRHGRACVGLTGSVDHQEHGRGKGSNPMTDVKLVLPFPWCPVDQVMALGGLLMVRAVSQGNLQGKDPHWLPSAALAWAKTPAAPALLEAAASSAAISSPLANAWTLQLHPANCGAAVMLSQLVYRKPSLLGVACCWAV